MDSLGSAQTSTPGNGSKSPDSEWVLVEPDNGSQSPDSGWVRVFYTLRDVLEDFRSD